MKYFKMNKYQVKIDMDRRMVDSCNIPTEEKRILLHKVSSGCHMMACHAPRFHGRYSSPCTKIACSRLSFLYPFW